MYVYDRVDDRENILRCLDLTTGTEEWTFTFEAPGSVSYDGTRSVPTIDGDRIYICDPFGNFHCLDKNSHQVLWHKNIWTDFGGTSLPRWAIAQNPLIYQDMVIVASQTGDVGLVAYDKQTGEVIWKTGKLPGVAAYVSPAIVKINGEDHVVMVSAQGRGGGGGRPPQGGRGDAPPTGQGAPAGASPAGRGAPGGAPPAVSTGSASSGCSSETGRWPMGS